VTVLETLSNTASSLTEPSSRSAAGTPATTGTLTVVMFVGSRPWRMLPASNVRTSPAETDQLMCEWVERDMPVPLTVLDSSFRDVTRPLIEHIAHLHRESSRDIMSVFVPERVVGHWWEHRLHNQSPLRLKARPLLQPGIVVTSVPFRLTSAETADPRRATASQEVPDPDRPEVVGR
jgi:hypothetical protein